MELKRVVVTGLGAVTPIGNNVPETWEAALAGKSGAAPITLFDASKHKTQFACEVKNFDPLPCFDNNKKEARKFDRYAQFAVAAATEAVKDANFDMDTLDKNRVGVIFASGIGGISTFEEEVGAYYSSSAEERTPRFNPFFIPKMIGDIAAGQISMMFGFRGPNFGTVSACASSTNAICCAFDTIRLGKANAIVTGGSEAAITAAGVGGFNSMRALSTRNDDPQSASRPFSASRDGFVMGEGSGCLVLEELEHALKRGAKIYAEVVGTAGSGDAHHITAPHPEGLGAKLVMEAALKDAEMNPEDIDYINVHGTSTHAGDIAEIKGVKEVFGDAAYKLNISSTKSMTGHMLGATGAVEALFCVLTVANDIIPPTINHADDDVDPELDPKLNYTFNKAQKREVRAALSNTFGFGGHNSTVIVKKFAK
ncbi:MAG: beta-ketoacyl-ACP synthase II [Paludibacteraceae bacterium]|nr:beta-ketoacyl-ACP synthase II [Paludibacteraceae bacterium]